MKSHRVVIVLAALLAGVLSVYAADVTGKWTASFDTQVGKQNYMFEFLVKGNQLTVKAKSDSGEGKITDSKISGETISFVESLNFQGNDLRIVYTGKVVSDSEIRFTRIVNASVLPMPVKEEFVAKRSK